MIANPRSTASRGQKQDRKLKFYGHIKKRIKYEWTRLRSLYLALCVQAQMILERNRRTPEGRDKSAAALIRTSVISKAGSSRGTQEGVVNAISSSNQGQCLQSQPHRGLLRTNTQKAQTRSLRDKGGLRSIQALAAKGRDTLARLSGVGAGQATAQSEG